ncbi:MAG: immunity 52 family protein [Hyalangium sp.]|uniref:immunity 52 family protein n=1 Tax=Hyalangium sp. TaxID=2028555 RepID=UPI00389B1FC7
METYYAGVYWGARGEDVGACAQRAELFFQMLAQCDATLGQWYRAGRVARGAPGHPMHTENREELKDLLLRGRSRTDLDKQIMEDLGFGLRVWNQQPDVSSTKVSLRCGASTEAVSNVCLVNLPSEGEAVERILTAPGLARILRCMATAWDPDWGIATSTKARARMSVDEQDADAGWLMYFARRRGTVPLLPAPVRIEPVGTLGTLVILTPERFTASNSEHLALGQRVHELLKRAGLLKSPPA